MVPAAKSTLILVKVPNPTSRGNKMDLRSVVLFVVIGIAAGWIAARLMKGGSFGLLGNLIIGAIGAFLGGWLFKLLGVSMGGGILGSLATAVVGAVALIYVMRLIKKA